MVKGELGEVVRAEFIDKFDDSFYKAIYRVVSGTPVGEIVHVAHRRGLSEFNLNILLRIETNIPKYSKLYGSNDILKGNFVTSIIPPNFDSSFANETIFYGLWKSRMKTHHSTPITGRISNFYDIGRFFNVLYFKNIFYEEPVKRFVKDKSTDLMVEKEFDFETAGFIIHPVSQYNKSRAIPIKHGASDKFRGPNNAIDYYLNYVTKHKLSVGSPRTVIIDETTNFDRLIGLIKLKREKYKIKLQPQL